MQVRVQGQEQEYNYEREQEQKKQDGQSESAFEEIACYQGNDNLQTTFDALSIVTDDEKFTAIHLPFAMGRSFMPDFRMAVGSILKHSGPIFTDGYMAFLRLVSNCQASRLGWTIPDMCQGAKGLQCLRDVQILRPEEAVCILLLGQALYVFEGLTDTFRIPASTESGNKVMTSAHSIMRSALISARPWYPMLVNEPALDTVTICPLLLDIVSCLVHREIPIIEPCIPNRVIVDRYVGISVTLLPLLHQICTRSHAAKLAAAAATSPTSPTSSSPGGGGGGSSNSSDGVASTAWDHTYYPPRDCYSDLEESIKHWTPSIPPDFFSKYDKSEVQMMTTQARAYRLAALLVIHRLRYPLGVRDDTARRYASKVFAEVSSAYDRLPRAGAAALPIGFPLFVSMLEIEGPGEMLLDQLGGYAIHSLALAKLRGFISEARLARVSGFSGLWFDLVEERLHYAVIP